MRPRLPRACAAFSLPFLLPACRPRPASPPPPVATITANAHPSNHPVIVRLTSRRQTITAYAGSTGPLYSVTDSTGRTILPPTPLVDIQAHHPDLYRDINSALATDASMGLDGQSSAPSPVP